MTGLDEDAARRESWENRASMAKSNLLNTRTINLLELLGNGRIYRVPAYQRDYSWEEDQWEDLWNDVMALRGQPDDRHYMGALVVEGQSDREFSIIDGQQRLATLSLLALAVIDRLLAKATAGDSPDENRERALALRARFVGEKDPASLIESSKLFLNETDDAFYQDYLVQLRPPLNPRGLRKSNRLLWECFRYFRGRLEQMPDVAGGAPLAELLSETVGRQLLFILITVDDELNAYMVFETLNARGLGLSLTDLLKNYLFSRIKVPSDLDALRRRWTALIATVAQERFPEFLRYHLLTEQPKVRSQNLFKIIRGYVVTPAQVFALMAALESRGELFAALSDPQHGYWAERPEARPFIRDLNLFRVRQPTPLLFAAWERFETDDFVRTLKLVTAISFRYTIVGGLNSNALEPAYHEAAKAVMAGTALKPGQVFRILQPIYVADAKFEQDFARMTIDTTGQRKKVAKYVLSRLQTDLSGRSCDPDTDSGSIEHILPENPADGWSPTFPAQLWETSIYRLGNLTLLEPALNRQVGSAGYATKVAAYATSAYEITRDVADLAPAEWTPALLDERQLRLAACAIQLWRSDFA